MADLRFKIIGDDTDIRKKLADLAKLQGESGRAFDKAFKGNASGARSIQDAIKSIVENTKKATTATQNLNKAQSSSSANAAREAQLANMEAMRQSRLEMQKQREELARLKVEQQQATISSQQHKASVDALKVSEQTLRNEYSKGKVDLATYTLEHKKLADAQRLQITAQKEADRVAKDAAAELRRREADQRREEAAAERRRKQLEKESSEYYKLNRALGELRKQSKDVLAEMFRLESQGKKNSNAYQELANKARGLVAQTNYLDRGIKKIDASLGLHQRNVGNYGNALEVISPQFAQINSHLSMMGVNLQEVASKQNGFKELGSTLMGVGKNILAFLVSPVGLVVTGLAALYALISGNAPLVKTFNSGLLNVSKTTGIAGAELDKMGDSVIRLSRDLEVIGTDKLMEYGTVAGQLGVKGTKDIMAFTEALAKLETASDIKGEEGGSLIARLLTLTDGGVHNVKLFGDEIVNLGNNFAATEKEILGNAEAISQNVGIYRIGRQDVLAYATATKAVGLEAEVVGSTFNRTLAEFEKTIRTGKGLSQTLAIIGGSSDELQKRFKTDAAGVFNDYVAGLNKIHREGGSVNKALTETGVIAVRDQRVIASLATNGFNVLTDALNTVREATGALDKEFTTAAGKLENQTKRIGIAWDNLVLSVENGTGAIGKATVFISEFFAEALEGVTNVVTSNSWGEFWTRINPTNWGRGESVTDVLNFKQVLKDTEAVNTHLRTLERHTMNGAKDFEINLEAGGVANFTKELEKAKESVDRIADARIKYEAAVKSGRLVEDDRASIAKYKIEESKAEAHYLKMQQLQFKFGFAPETATANTNSTTPELTEAEQKALARQKEVRLKSQRSLQAEIDKMIDESKRKQLTSDEEELQSIIDKYDERRNKIQEFNSDPLNNKVDGSGLGAAQRREEDEARAKHQLSVDKQMYAERKVLFDEYQGYIDQVGIKEANKRFSAELEGFKTYAEYLKSLMPVDSDQSAYANKVRDELKKEIPKAEKDETKRQQDRYTKALIAARTHGQQLEAIEAEYQANIAAIADGASASQIARLTKDRDDAVNSANAEALEKTEIFRQLYDDLDYMGTESARKAIKTGREQLESFIRVNGITGKQADELRKKFGRILTGFERSVEDRIPDGLKNVATEIQNVASEVALVDARFGEILGTVGNIVGAVGNIKSNLSSIKDSQTIGGIDGLLGGISGGLGIFSAVSGVMNGVASIFSASARRQEEQFQRSQEMQLKQTEAMTRALDRQLALIKDLYGTARLTEYKEGLEEIEKQQVDFSASIEGKKIFTGDGYTDDLIKDLNSGRRSMEDLNNELRLYEMRAKTLENPMDRQFAADNARKLSAALELIGDTAVLTGKETTKELLDIYASLDEGTQKGVDNLIELEQKHKDTLNAMREETTGSSFQDLVSSLVGVYANGGTSAGEAFGEAFDNTLEQYLLKTLSREFLEEKTQGWYELFNELADEGLTSDEKSTLRDEWDKIGEATDKYFKDLQESTGITVKDKETGKGKTGLGIEGIKETTANRLEGEFGGLRLAQLQLLEVAKGQTSLLQQNTNYAMQNLQAALAIQNNTFRTANNTDRLLNIETAIVSLNNKIVNTDALQRGAG